MFNKNSAVVLLSLKKYKFIGASNNCVEIKNAATPIKNTFILALYFFFKNIMPPIGNPTLTNKLKTIKIIDTLLTILY
ncbi:hypothetical protein, partial [Clostridium perfringens]|uniref:hypothetical protein n=1 Tax=Clostridium perfringens TaxID=1502 RepID=UPI002ACC2FD7